MDNFNILLIFPLSPISDKIIQPFFEYWQMATLTVYDHGGNVGFGFWVSFVIRKASEGVSTQNGLDRVEHG
jgi:hypothetical protein